MFRPNSACPFLRGSGAPISPPILGARARLLVGRNRFVRYDQRNVVRDSCSTIYGIRNIDGGTDGRSAATPAALKASSWLCLPSRNRGVDLGTRLGADQSDAAHEGVDGKVGRPTVSLKRGAGTREARVVWAAYAAESAGTRRLLRAPQVGLLRDVRSTSRRGGECVEVNEHADRVASAPARHDGDAVESDRSYCCTWEPPAVGSVPWGRDWRSLRRRRPQERRDGPD